jgi:fructokinase
MRDASGDVEGFSVEAIDTLAQATHSGQGCCINSALRQLDAALNGDKLRSMLRFANACGALATLKTGAIPALPTKAEVEAFLSETE